MPSVRDTLREHKVCLINVMGSPGAGKTSLLTALIAPPAGSSLPSVSSRGDITGQIDAEKIAALNIPAVQLNTDGACHIEAHEHPAHPAPVRPGRAWTCCSWRTSATWSVPPNSDIGENFRLTVLSIPEGDDKVAKYPLMFTDTDCLVLTKCDMLPYFDFDLERVTADYRGVNPQGPLFRLSGPHRRRPG